MQIEIRKTAIKDLDGIPKDVKAAIHLKIGKLKNFPNIANIKKLTNFEPAYRLRIGDYRILFDVVDNEKIVIGRILHRKESWHWFTPILTS
jgi:mRNA interferase RelE/StbE